MKFVVFGAGAIGGVVGARLFQRGHDVTLLARGAHLEVLRNQGLTLEMPDQSVTLPIPATSGPGDIGWDEPAVVLLAVKSQDTDDALRALADVAPESTPVVCLQNGVENERRALRIFPNTYGVVVMCPATHLEPGRVQAHWAPVTALLDIGRYPSGLDDTAHGIASAFSTSHMDSRPLDHVMRWKYRKLLMNLGNALDALCGPGTRSGGLGKAVLAEGESVLRAASIDVASPDEDAERRRITTGIQPTASGRHQGSSTWQSLARGTGSIETNYLTGEIVLLGRLHGVPTPVNALVQRLAGELAAGRREPGSLAEQDLGTLLD